MIKIGAIEIPYVAGHNVRETLNKTGLGGRSVLRSKNGTGRLTVRWQKLSVSISGTGWMPDGLDALDDSADVDIHSVTWLGVSGASNVLTIPRAFRTDDYAPIGVAIVNGDAVETPVALAGNVATLDAVAGASQYQIQYCPVITALITAVNRDYDQQQKTWSWSVEAEEA